MLGLAQAVDPVGGATTAYLIRTMKYGGSIALSGLTGGGAFGTTVYPFILRAVNLLGIDSVRCSRERRISAFERLARDVSPQLIESLVGVAPLADVPRLAHEIVDGRVRGRLVIDVNR